MKHIQKNAIALLLCAAMLLSFCSGALADEGLDEGFVLEQEPEIEAELPEYTDPEGQGEGTVPETEDPFEDDTGDDAGETPDGNAGQETMPQLPGKSAQNPPAGLFTDVYEGSAFIGGTTADMEYSLDGGATYLPCSDTATVVTRSGNYLVRFRETDTLAASEPTTVGVVITAAPENVMDDGTEDEKKEESSAEEKKEDKDNKPEKKPDGYALWIGGAEASPDELTGAGWSFDAVNYILTLYGGSIEPTGISDGIAGIAYEGSRDLIINTLDATLLKAPAEAEKCNCYGVYNKSEHKISFAGSGKLVICSGETDVEKAASYGIFSNGNIEINADADVEAISGNGSNASVAVYTPKDLAVSGSLTATANNAKDRQGTDTYQPQQLSAAIQAANVMVNGENASLTATSDSDAAKSVGISVTGTVQSNGTIAAKGSVWGISSGYLTANGGSISAEGCYGIQAYTVISDGSKVTATGYIQAFVTAPEFGGGYTPYITKDGYYADVSACTGAGTAVFSPADPYSAAPESAQTEEQTYTFDQELSQMQQGTEQNNAFDLDQFGSVQNFFDNYDDLTVLEETIPETVTEPAAKSNISLIPEQNTVTLPKGKVITIPVEVQNSAAGFSVVSNNTAVINAFAAEGNGVTIAGLSAGTTTVLLTSDEDSSVTAQITVTVPQAVKNIVCRTEKTVINIGDSETVYVSFEPDTAANRSFTVTSQDNGSIISLEEGTYESGAFTVTGLSAGTATIVVKSNDPESSAERTFSLEVNDPKVYVSGISFYNSAWETVSSGEITGEDGALTLCAMADNTADNTGITFASSDETVATVSAAAVNGAYFVAVQAHKAGTAVITASAEDGSGVTAECMVTVTAAEPEHQAAPAAVGSGAAETELFEFSTEVEEDETEDVFEMPEESAEDDEEEDTFTLNEEPEEEEPEELSVSKNPVTEIKFLSYDFTSGAFSETAEETIPEENGALTLCVFANDNADDGTLTFTSSDESVATVSTIEAEGAYAVTVQAHKAGTAVITASAEDGSDVTAECTVAVGEEEDEESATESFLMEEQEDNVDKNHNTEYAFEGEGGTASVSAIFIENDSITVSIGEQVTQKITFDPLDATNQKFTTQEPEPAGIVTVDSNETSICITGVAEGTATITVTSDDNPTASAQITVTVTASSEEPIPVKSVAFYNSSDADASAVPSVEIVGTTDKKTVYAWADVQATNRELKFSLNEEGKSFVIITTTEKGSGIYSVEIQPIAPGTAEITAEAQDGSGKNAVCLVTVKEEDIYPTSISVSTDGKSYAAANDLTLEGDGDSKEIYIKIIPDECTVTAVDLKYDNEKIDVEKTDEETGKYKITALKENESETVTFTTKKAEDGEGEFSGKSASLTVKINGYTYKPVSGKETITYSVETGGDQTVVFNAPYEKAKTGEVHLIGEDTDKTLIKDSDYSLEKGSTKLTLKEDFLKKQTPGEYTLTVLFTNEKRASVGLKIISDADVPVKSVTLTVPKKTLSIGETLTLTATVLPVDATNKELEWSSDSTSFVSLDKNYGDTVNAYGNSLGTAIITVKSKVDTTIQETCTLTVVEKEKPPIIFCQKGEKISDKNKQLPINGNNPEIQGANGKLSVYAYIDGESDAKLKFESSNKAVADVTSTESKGFYKVTLQAHSLGDVTITASAEDESLTPTELKFSVKKAVYLNKLELSTDQEKYDEEINLTLEASGESGDIYLRGDPSNASVLSFTVNYNQSLFTFAKSSNGNRYIVTAKESNTEGDIVFLTKAEGDDNNEYTGPSAIAHVTVGDYTYKPIPEDASITYDKKTGGDKTAEVSAPYDKFTEAKLDGNKIAETYYTVEKGSTKITLKEAYLNTLSVGNHTLTLSYSTGKDVPVPVKVVGSSATSMKVTPEKTTLGVDETVSVDVAFTPDDADDTVYKVTSSDTTVVEVPSEELDDETFDITGLKIGTATVRVESISNPALFKTFSVTVTKPAVYPEALLVSNDDEEYSDETEIELTAKEGSKAKVYIAVAPEETTVKSILPTGFDTKLISISQITKNFFYVSAIGDKTGETDITLKTKAEGDSSSEYNGPEATVHVTVGSSTPVESITIYNTSGEETNYETTTVSGTVSLYAVVSPEEATTNDVNWSSSNASIASVTPTDGQYNHAVVTGRSTGTAKITAAATDGSGIKAECYVVVSGSGTTTYTITYKDNSGMWYYDNPTNYTVRCSGPYSGFYALSMDGTVINSSYYRAQADATYGGTNILIAKQYLATLSHGTHTLTVWYNNGQQKASTYIYIQSVTDAPRTGDSGFGPALWAAVLSAMGMAGCAVVLKKKKTAK